MFIYIFYVYIRKYIEIMKQDLSKAGIDLVFLSLKRGVKEAFQASF